MSMDNEQCWTLGYEAEGSDMAAWTVRWRPGDSSDSVVYETTDEIDSGDPDKAKNWASKYLSDVQGETVTDWRPVTPHEWAAPDYWVATTK